MVLIKINKYPGSRLTVTGLTRLYCIQIVLPGVLYTKLTAGSMSSCFRWMTTKTMMMMMTTMSRTLFPVERVPSRMALEYHGAEKVGVTHGVGQVSRTTSITATSTAHWSVGVNLSIDSLSQCCVHAWPAMLVASAPLPTTARTMHL